VTLDPDLAAVLGAGLFAAVVALGGAWRRRRDVERYCVECGRRVLAGVRTCGCGH
jgi:MYXO-CTERM domain-containing protein